MSDMNTPLQTALNSKRGTSQWLLTSQAAVMAQLDEQVRGQSAGLIPGEDNPDALRDWITTNYGARDPITTAVPDAARPAAELRHWQSQRLTSSALVLVAGDVAKVISRLASTGLFSTTPELPQNLPNSLTFVWASGQRSSTSTAVSTPGALDADNQCCAVTVDATHTRIIEWSPTPSIDALSTDLVRMLTEAGGTIPPWIVGCDSGYAPSVTTTQDSRCRIMQASSIPPGECLHAPLLEQANALIESVNAGLIRLIVQKHGDTTVYLPSPPA